MNAPLLSKEEFQTQALKRDNNQCVCCNEKATSVHHIMERQLFEDGGYYLDNAASLCDEHHLAAEKTLISCEALRKAAGITQTILPEHLDPAVRYDKWANPFLNKDLRGRGELFYEENVQKILQAADLLSSFTERTKYPKTLHLPWSPGLQNDDRLLSSFSGLENEEIVATLKMDGENTTMTRDYIHARSLDSKNHPSRNWVKTLWGQIKHEIPKNMSICGENLFAEHSIHYDNLPTYFLVFNIWERGRRLSWDDTQNYCEMLGLTPVPVLYRGKWDKEKIQELTKTLDPKGQEGLVIQVAREIRASEWKKTSAKFVRKGHVQTDQFWMTKPVVQNGLAKTPGEISFLGHEPTPTVVKSKPSKPQDLEFN